MTDDFPAQPRRASEGDWEDPVDADDTAASDESDAAVAPRHAAFMRPGSVPEELLSEPALSEVAVTGDTEIIEDVEESVPEVTSIEPSEDDEPAEETDELVAGRPDPSFGTGAKIITGLVALGIAGGAFYGVRAATTEDPVVVETTASVAQSSSTPTPTPKPAFTKAMLITPQDASKALRGTWTEKQTWDPIPDSAPGITCMSNLRDMPNTVLSTQRGLSSDAKSQTALLQRLDAYATEADAQKAFQIQLKALSACDDVPALITSAASIERAGDEAFSMTVAFEDDPQVMHTVVLTRNGRTVGLVDVANTDAPAVSGNAALRATAPTLARLCKSSGGTCPDNPIGKVTNFPPTPIVGWLAQSDIPRITKGQGMWSSTTPVKVSTTGSQCEDMTFATVKGPQKREQRSYLLTQDDAAPDRFGIDEVLFSFGSDKEASDFAKKVIGNVDGCPKRTSTGKVADAKEVSTTVDGVQLTGKTWQVTQATGPTSTVIYRVGVVQAGTKVTYTVSNVTKSFNFTTDTWQAVNVRAGLRATQAK